MAKADAYTYSENEFLTDWMLGNDPSVMRQARIDAYESAEAKEYWSSIDAIADKLDNDASYSAWLHELQHLADDEASGWQGMKIVSLPYEELAFEERAYRLEIDFARKSGYSKIAKRLERLLFERRQEILGTQRNNKQSQA